MKLGQSHQQAPQERQREQPDFHRALKTIQASRVSFGLGITLKWHGDHFKHVALVFEAPRVKHQNVNLNKLHLVLPTASNVAVANSCPVRENTSIEILFMRQKRLISFISFYFIPVFSHESIMFNSLYANV